MKDTKLWVQAQETLSRINTKKTTLFIAILLKIKDRENLENTQTKTINNMQGTMI